MKKETMSEGQPKGLEEQLRNLSPIISAAMEKKAVINLTIYAGNIGQKIDHATHVLMEADEECRMLFRKGTVEARKKTTDDKREPPSAEKMATACIKTNGEGLWWGNASWSVAFRIYCILGYEGNEESFIEEVKGWPFRKPFKYVCNRNSLDRPLRRGRINGPLEKWAAEGASKREVKLGERLMKILMTEKTE